MKLPPSIRTGLRRLTRVGSAPTIQPEELAELAANEPVVVLALSSVGKGRVDPRLPGEQRAINTSELADSVVDVPKDRVIITHCT